MDYRFFMELIIGYGFRILKDMDFGMDMDLGYMNLYQETKTHQGRNSFIIETGYVLNLFIGIFSSPWPRSCKPCLAKSFILNRMTSRPEAVPGICQLGAKKAK